MKSSFLIENAKLSDVNSLLYIENLVFNSEDGMLSRRSFKRHIQSHHITLILRDTTTKEVIGYILVFCYKCSARIYSFALHPMYQGHGLAKKLLHSALSQIKLLPYNFIKLEVKENNTPAIKLYESFGFQTKQILTNYYGFNQNALSMRLKLNTISHA